MVSNIAACAIVSQANRKQGFVAHLPLVII